MVTIASEENLAKQSDINEIKIKCAEHSTNNKLMAKDIADIKSDIQEIKEVLKNLGSKFVTKQEFSPVKAIAYGMVGAILLAFLGGVVALVWKI